MRKYTATYDPLCQGCPFADITLLLFKDCKNCIGKGLCKYDEAFTQIEMLEETDCCKDCQLDCPVVEIRSKRFGR